MFIGRAVCCCASKFVYTYKTVCVCVCVCERERECVYMAYNVTRAGKNKMKSTTHARNRIIIIIITDKHNVVVLAQYHAHTWKAWSRLFNFFFFFVCAYDYLITSGKFCFKKLKRIFIIYKAFCVIKITK